MTSEETTAHRGTQASWSSKSCASSLTSFSRLPVPGRRGAGRSGAGYRRLPAAPDPAGRRRARPRPGSGRPPPAPTCAGAPPTAAFPRAPVRGRCGVPAGRAPPPARRLAARGLDGRRGPRLPGAGRPGLPVGGAPALGAGAALGPAPHAGLLLRSGRAGRGRRVGAGLLRRLRVHRARDPAPLAHDAGPPAAVARGADHPGPPGQPPPGPDPGGADPPQRPPGGAYRPPRGGDPLLLLDVGRHGELVLPL